MAKTTRKAYMEFLNKEGEIYDKNSFNIGGKMRSAYYPDRFGKALRKYDSLAFDVGYQEYVRINHKRY